MKEDTSKSKENFVDHWVLPIKITMSCLFWYRENAHHTWSEVEVLKLAAGVESNTVHPVGKAIVEAARASDCQNTKVHSSVARWICLFRLAFYANAGHIYSSLMNVWCGKWKLF